MKITFGSVQDSEMKGVLSSLEISKIDDFHLLVTDFEQKMEFDH